MSVTESQLESYVRMRSAMIRAAIMQVSDDQPTLTRAKAESGGFSSGSITVGSALLYSYVKVSKLKVPQSNFTEIHFSGDSWGFGLGVGNFVGLGDFFASADELLKAGTLGFQMEGGAVGGGIMEINFFTKKKFYGFLAGPGIGIQGGGFGGSGKFAKGSS